MRRQPGPAGTISQADRPAPRSCALRRTTVGPARRPPVWFEEPEERQRHGKPSRRARRADRLHDLLASRRSATRFAAARDVLAALFSLSLLPSVEARHWSKSSTGSPASALLRAGAPLAPHGARSATTARRGHACAAVLLAAQSRCAEPAHEFSACVRAASHVTPCLSRRLGPHAWRAWPRAGSAHGPRVGLRRGTRARRTSPRGPWVRRQRWREGPTLQRPFVEP